MPSQVASVGALQLGHFSDFRSLPWQQTSYVALGLRRGKYKIVVMSGHVTISCLIILTIILTITRMIISRAFCPYGYLRL